MKMTAKDRTIAVHNIKRSDVLRKEVVCKSEAGTRHRDLVGR
jgi:hypothetical protein